MADWSDIRYFLEVSREGTLAAAGRRLGVDSTTVGRRLTLLERELSARLFERTPEGLVPTIAGEAIRGIAEEMERAALTFEQRALGADRKLAGLVRLATTETLAEVIALPALLTLHRRHPEIRIELLTGASRLDLARREADLALRYYRPEGGELASRRVARIGTAAYGSRDLLAKEPAPPRGSGLAGRDVVGLEARIRGERAMELAGEKLRDARFVLRTSNTLTLREAIARGLGFGALPCCIGDPHPLLRRLWPEAPPELDDLWLVVHRDVQRTGRVRAVIEALDEQLSQIGPALRGEQPRRR